jgi:DNA replication protein DnaC
MEYKQIYNEVMQSLEADRNRASALHRARQAELCGRFPRLAEIEAGLTALGARTARAVTEKDADKNALLTEMREASAALKAERDQILRENGILESYFSRIYTCATCEDTGFTRDEGAPVRCRCLKQRLIDRYYDLSTIRTVLRRENFDHFDLRYYSDVPDPREGISPHRNMQIIYQVAMEFVQSFDEAGVFKNLLFYGETGLGKTFLCNCIAKDVLDKGYTILYKTAPQIFKMVEDYRFRGGGADDGGFVLNDMYDVDLLILDDLGSEFSTVVTSAALFDIINQRILTQRATVISTNLSHADIDGQYTDRIGSRLMEFYTMCKFYGEDIRHKKKYGKVGTAIGRP